MSDILRRFDATPPYVLHGVAGIRLHSRHRRECDTCRAQPIVLVSFPPDIFYCEPCTEAAIALVARLADPLPLRFSDAVLRSLEFEHPLYTSLSSSSPTPRKD